MAIRVGGYGGGGSVDDAARERVNNIIIIHILSCRCIIGYIYYFMWLIN